MEKVVAAQQSVFGSVRDERATHLTLPLVFVSGVALAAQVVMSDYGTGQQGASSFWFVIGCVLLWLVYSKRSRAARGFVIVTSLVGAIVFGLGAVGDAHSAFLAMAFLAQAVPLMSSQVRLHVQTAA